MIDTQTAGAVILIAGALFAGYAFARWPELPGLLKRSVRKVRDALDAARAEGIPDELKDLYDLAYAEVLAWDASLADDRLTWAELRAIGIHALRLGKAVLAKLG